MTCHMFLLALLSAALFLFDANTVAATAAAAAAEGGTTSDVCSNSDAEVDALRAELAEKTEMLRTVNKQLRSFLMNETHFQVPYKKQQKVAGTCSECVSTCWKDTYTGIMRSIKNIFAPIGNTVLEFKLKAKVIRFWRAISKYFSESPIIDFIVRKIYMVFYFTKQKIARYIRLLQSLF
jgi:hypothetical protein